MVNRRLATYFDTAEYFGALRRETEGCKVGCGAPRSSRGRGRVGLGDPSSALSQGLIATSDMAGADPTSVYSGASQLQNNISSLKSYSQALTSAGGNVTQAAAQLAGGASQIQSQLQNVIANGVSISGISAATAGSLLNTAFSDLGPLVGKLGTTPRLLIGVGEGIASGALAGAVGGPIGSCVGAIAGAVSAILAGAGSSSSNAWVPLAPSGGAQAQLAQLQSWLQTNQAFNEPLGWQLYDYVSQNSPYAQSPVAGYKGSICTPWLWGLDSSQCDRPAISGISCLPAYQFSTPNNDLARIGDEMGQPVTSAAVTTAVQRASQLAGFYSFFGPNSGTGGTGNGLMAWAQNIGITPQQSTTCTVAPPYAYFFALGTVMTMIAAQASDQSIAAELILQQKVITDFYAQDAAPTAVAGEALMLQPLVDYFLALSPSIASIQAGTMSAVTGASAAGATAAIAASSVAAVLGGAAVYAYATGGTTLGVLGKMWGKTRGLVKL